MGSFNIFPSIVVVRFIVFSSSDCKIRSYLCNPSCNRVAPYQPCSCPLIQLNNAEPGSLHRQYVPACQQRQRRKMMPSKHDVLSMYNKVSSRVKQYALSMTPLELKVEEATSNEPWGPHGTVMAEVSRAAFDYDNYKQIMGVVARRLQSEGENWRHVYKSLLLLEYMSKHGPQKVVDELSSNITVVERLQRFEYQDKNGKDWGLNVRQRAKELANLIADPDCIKRERQKAKQNESKYTGVSADESRMGFGSSSSSFGGNSSSFGGSALGGSALGGISSSKGFGPTGGFGSSSGFGSFAGRYDDDMDAGHQRLETDDAGYDDEDAREATRRRVESLKTRMPEPVEGANRVTPLKGGRTQAPAEPESKGPKRLSQVKVNPNIAASLGVPSRGASPVPAAASAPPKTSAASPTLNLFGSDDAPATAPANNGSPWDAFGGAQGPPAAAAPKDEWSILLDHSGPSTASHTDPPAYPLAQLASASAKPSAAISAARLAASTDPFAAVASVSPSASAGFGADPFGEFSSMARKTSGPLPLAPAPQKPDQDPFAALTSTDPFAPAAPKAQSPLKAATSVQAGRSGDPLGSDPFAMPALTAAASPGKPATPPGGAAVAPSSRIGQALPEDMFSAPMATPAFSVRQQQGARPQQGGSPSYLQQAWSSSPGRHEQQAGGDAFGAFGSASQPLPQSTEDLFGSMAIGSAKGPGPASEALGGGLKMAPNMPQPNLPPPVIKKDPFAGLAGF